MQEVLCSLRWATYYSLKTALMTCKVWGLNRSRLGSTFYVLNEDKFTQAVKITLHITTSLSTSKHVREAGGLNSFSSTVAGNWHDYFLEKKCTCLIIVSEDIS